MALVIVIIMSLYIFTRVSFENVEGDAIRERNKLESGNAVLNYLAFQKRYVDEELERKYNEDRDFKAKMINTGAAYIKKGNPKIVKPSELICKLVAFGAEGKLPIDIIGDGVDDEKHGVFSEIEGKTISYGLWGGTKREIYEATETFRQFLIWLNDFLRRHGIEEDLVTYVKNENRRKGDFEYELVTVYLTEPGKGFSYCSWRPMRGKYDFNATRGTIGNSNTNRNVMFDMSAVGIEPKKLY